ERDRDGDQRRGADDDRRARGPRLLHREREEHLRAAGGEQAGEEELPAAVKVVPGQRSDKCQRRRPEEHRDRRGPDVTAPEADPDRDRHRAEGDRGGEREQDDGHASVGRRTTLDAIPKRTAMNGSTWKTATMSSTWTKVTPNTSVTRTRARSGRTERLFTIRHNRLRLVADGSIGRCVRPSPPRSPDKRHGPVQLPLHLLHAEGGLRPRLPVPRPPGAAQLRGGHPRRARRRLPRRDQPPPD